jgi:hypothetical protein
VLEHKILVYYGVILFKKYEHIAHKHIYTSTGARSHSYRRECWLLHKSISFFTRLASQREVWFLMHSIYNSHFNHPTTFWFSTMVLGYQGNIYFFDKDQGYIMQPIYQIYAIDVRCDGHGLVHVVIPLHENICLFCDFFCSQLWCLILFFWRWCLILARLVAMAGCN